MIKENKGVITLKKNEGSHEVFEEVLGKFIYLEGTLIGYKPARIERFGKDFGWGHFMPLADFGSCGGEVVWTEEVTHFEALSDSDFESLLEEKMTDRFKKDKERFIEESVPRQGYIVLSFLEEEEEYFEAIYQTDKEFFDALFV